MLGGVLPTPAVALLALDLGAVVSASHNPPEYNGVKLFDRDGQKLTDEQEEDDRGAVRRPRARRRLGRPGRRGDGQLPGARARALRLRPHRPADRGRLRERRLRGARARSLRAARRGGRGGRQRRPTVPISTSAAAPPTSRCCSRSSSRSAATSASPSTATATACWPSTARGRSGRRRPDPRRARARPRSRSRRCDRDDEPRLPPPHGGARHPGRDDRRRRPLCARGAAPRGRRARAASSRGT